MPWNQALPLADTESLEHLPKFEVIDCFGCLSRTRLAVLPADLLVLTVMSKTHLHEAFSCINISTDGQLAEALDAQGFSGKQGERVLIDLSGSNCPQKYILVVGLGDYRSMSCKTSCALFGEVFDVVDKLNLTSVLIPIPPRRLSEGALQIKGLCAVLRCRVEERILQGRLKNLERIQIACSSQARRYVEAGLRIAGPRCFSCQNPQLRRPGTQT